MTLNVTVDGRDGSQATGDVRVTVDGGTPIEVTLVNGAAAVDLGSFSTAGDKSVTVEYLGSDTLDGSTRTITIVVSP